MPGVVAQSGRAFSPAYEPVLPYRQPTRFALRRPPLFDFSRNFITVGGKPRLPLVEQADGVLYELIDGLVRTALNVLPNLFFQLRAKMDIHVG
jgi:hypothetical protein